MTNAVTQRTIIKRSRVAYADTANRFLASNGHWILPVPTLDDERAPERIGECAYRYDPDDPDGPWRFDVNPSAASAFTKLCDTFGHPGDHIDTGRHAELVRLSAYGGTSHVVAFAPKAGEFYHRFQAKIGYSRVPCALANDYIRLFERAASKPREFGLGLRYFANCRADDFFVGGGVAVVDPKGMAVIGFLMPADPRRL